MPKHRDQFLAKKVSYEWKIENFLNRKFYDDILDSPKFLFSDAYFRIRIFPNGINKAFTEWVRVYLYKVSSLTNHRVAYTLGFKRDDGSVLVSRHFKHLFGRLHQRNPMIIEKSTLANSKEKILGPGGTLTVFCEIDETDDSSTEAETQTYLTDSFQTLSKDFEKFYLSGGQTDVVLHVRGEKFSAHRSILSSRSSIFRTMFEVDMKEREAGVVNITDCDPASFRAFLLFLYSGKMDVVSLDNALGLYAAAHKYNVQELKKECCECLAREMSVDSICDVLRLAALHEERELLKRATTYSIKNASKIFRTQEWLTFSGDNPTLANELYLKMADTLADSLSTTIS